MDDVHLQNAPSEDGGDFCVASIISKLDGHLSSKKLAATKQTTEARGFGLSYSASQLVKVSCSLWISGFGFSSAAEVAVLIVIGLDFWACTWAICWFDTDIGNSN